MTAFVFIDSTNMQETIFKSGENSHFGVFYKSYSKAKWSKMANLGSEFHFLQNE